MDHILVRCECGETLRVKPKHGGRTGKCKNCRSSIEIPAADVIENNLGREVSLGELSLLGKPDRDLSLGEHSTLKNDADTNTAEKQTPVRSKHDSSVSGLWQPGQLVDNRYQVEKQLGKGGCGIVWKARHTEWNLDLAVKEFIDDSTTKPKIRERRRKNFIRESQAWVDDVGMHPHVVTAWYVRELNDTPYLFLEYCDGGDLSEWIDQGKTRELKTALDIAIQLAWGLAHCHGKGIVHRDFKPQNVMMTSNGMAKITDFGMVKFAAIASDDEETDDEVDSVDNRQTMGGGLRGTPPYMPPEQWVKQNAQIDHRADIYALGVTIYELLTGELPIRPTHGSIPEWIQTHTNSQPASLADSRDDVPSELEQLVQQCLAKSVDDRPADANALVESLLQIYEAACSEPYGRSEPGEIQPLADGFNNQGVSLFDLRKTKAAKQRFETAILSDPHHPEANYNLGLLRWHSAEITDRQVIDSISESSKSLSNNMVCDQLAAFVHLERGDFENALRLLESSHRRAENKGAVSRIIASTNERLLADCAPKRATLVAYRKSSTQRESKHPWRTGKGEGILMEIWKCFPQKTLTEFKGHFDQVEALQYIGQERRLLTSSRDGTIRLWDLLAHRLLQTFDCKGSESRCIAVSRDEKLMLSSHSDGLRLWDLHNGYLIRGFGELPLGWTTLEFSPDSRMALANGPDATVCLFELENGRCLTTIRHDQLQKCGFSDEGDFLCLLGTKDQCFRLSDVGTQTAPLRLSKLQSSTRAAAVQARASQRLSNAKRAFKAGRFARAANLLRKIRSEPGHERKPDVVSQWSKLYRRLQRVEIRGGWQVAEFRGDRSQLGNPLVNFSADSCSVLSWVSYSAIVAWDVRTGTCLKSFDGMKLCLNGSDCKQTFLHDGRRAVKTDNNKLEIWDCLARRRLLVMDEHTKHVEAVSLSPCGRYLMTACSRVGRLWDLDKRKCVRLFDGMAAPVSFTSDGQYAYSGGAAAVDRESCNLRMWSVKTGECIKLFNGYASPRDPLVSSPTGRWFIAVNGEDRKLRIWNTLTARYTRSIGNKGEFGCASVVISADGRFAVAGLTGQISLYCLVTGERVLRLKIPRTGSGGIPSVALSPDSRYVLAATDEGSVTVWFLDWELENRDRVDWHDDALPYLFNFLTLRESRKSLFHRRPIQKWSDEDFQQLLQTLGCAGYGWLRPEGVQQKLFEMRDNWTGPPPLPGE